MNPTRPIGSGLPGRVASSPRISNALNHDCIELGALLLIGDGIVGLIKPSWHSLLWHFGPALANSSIWSHGLDTSNPSSERIKLLRSFRQLYGKKLGASDGDIRHVKDFHFFSSLAIEHGDFLS